MTCSFHVKLIVNSRIFYLMQRLPLFISLIIFSHIACESKYLSNDQPVHTKMSTISNFHIKTDFENNSESGELPQDSPLANSENYHISKRSENKSYKVGPKITVDSDNEYRSKFQKISQNKDFLDSIRKLDDGTVEKNVSVSPKTKEEIEELKEVMKVLFPSVSSGSGIMIELLNKIKNNTDNIVHYLVQLNDILHDIDVAVDFNRYDGYKFFMNKIQTTLKQALVSPSQLALLLEQQNLTILNKFMHVFVPAAQNNDKVKDMLIKLDFSTFLLKTVESIFEQNYVKVESFDSFLYTVVLSMETFLISCPNCSISLLSNSHYNHTFGKLLSLPPDSKTWIRTVRLLKILLKERDEIQIEDDKEYVGQLKKMSDILDKTLVNEDSICQLLTTFVTNYFLHHQRKTSTMDTLMGSIHSFISSSKNNHNFENVVGLVGILHDRLCPDMKSNEEVLSFLKLNSAHH